MEIVKAKDKHIKDVCLLYENAVSYFKQNNINQWQNGYPCLESLLQDIKNGESYVVLHQNTVAATFMLSVKKELTYNAIYSGAWQGTDNYGVIHRVSVSPDLKGKGIFKAIIDFAVLHCKKCEKNSLRCDTHKDNLSMQRALQKKGFTLSGTIYLDKEKQDPRLVYEKPLK